MSKKKYYAVRNGIRTGIFESWSECQAATSGYSKAEFKSFSNKKEAQEYLDEKETKKENTPYSDNKVIAYVDGSYNNTIKKYSFGCVILLPSGKIIKESGNGDNPESLAIRNVAGEMLGAMFAVKWALVNDYKEIEIRYDYQGIEKWVTGEWKAKNELTQKYASAMNKWKSSIEISFQKVTAHSNNHFNDEADQLAKKALTGADGIPKISKMQ